MHEKYDKAKASLKRFNITASDSQLKVTHGVLAKLETKGRSVEEVNEMFENNTLLKVKDALPAQDSAKAGQK